MRSTWVPNHPEPTAAYLAGTRHPGWEKPSEVAARFEAAISRHRRTAGERRLVVVPHGMAMTRRLAHIGRLSDPVAFWRRPTFPDHVHIDLTGDTGVE